jgi:hypothetical protein
MASLRASDASGLLDQGRYCGGHITTRSGPSPSSSNDMGAVNVDTRLMKNGSASLSRVDKRLVEMQNG